MDVLTGTFSNESGKWNFDDDEERRRAIEAEATERRRMVTAKPEADISLARIAADKEVRMTALPVGIIIHLIWALAVTTIGVAVACNWHN